MRILLLFTITINLLTAQPNHSFIDYFIGNSLNNKAISFNQTTLDFIESLFENEPTTSPEIRHKILKNFISYGIQQGFNHKTILGHFTFNNPSEKVLPHIEKIADPFDISKNILKIKLNPEKFKMKADEKLVLSVGLKSEASKEPVISMTPAMKALFKEMSQKGKSVNETYKLEPGKSISKNATYNTE
jgi:hypothetical protein